MALTPPIELTPRKRPTQQRAKERFERILAATAELLDEVGIDALNTNLIATRAGVQIASLYQYFPNKYAILTELARRMVLEQEQLLDTLITPNGFTRPWPEVIDHIFDMLLPDEESQAGAVAIRLAVAAVPELAEVRDWERRSVTEHLSAALRGAGVQLTAAELRIVALTLFTTATAMLNEAMQSEPADAAALVAEVKHLHREYLKQYLPPTSEATDKR